VTYMGILETVGSAFRNRTVGEVTPLEQKNPKWESEIG
jgi:hypothetical protein